MNSLAPENMKPSLLDLNFIMDEPIFIKEVEVLTNPLHFHADFELTLIEVGSGTRIIGDHIASFQSGDLVFLGPELPHIWFNDEDLYKKENPIPIKATVVYLKRRWMEGILLKLSMDKSLQSLMDNSLRGLKFSGETLRMVTRKLKILKGLTGLKQVIELLQILDILSDSKDFEYLANIGYNTGINKPESLRMHKVYEYIMNNFTNPISLKDVADIANMAPNSFCRYFKAHSQKTVVDFINEVRISYATKLLMQEEKSIVDVSIDCGFQNLTNFNKFFRKYINMSPTEYRKNILKTQGINLS